MKKKRPKRKHRRHSLIAFLVERDGPNCAICEQPVDPSLFNGPMKPSIDHIIPVLHGGKNDRANYRLTHVICNNRRGSPSPMALVREAATVAAVGAHRKEVTARLLCRRLGCGLQVLRAEIVVRTIGHEAYGCVWARCKVCDAAGYWGALEFLAAAVIRANGRATSSEPMPVEGAPPEGAR